MLPADRPFCKPLPVPGVTVLTEGQRSFKTVRMSRGTRPLPSPGFTLVELLVTLAVIGLLLPVTAAALQSLVSRHRLTAGSNQFLHTLYLARSEAVQRGQRVTVAPAGDNWEQGWIVFPDPNANGRRDPNEPLLAAGGPLPPGYTLRGNGPVRRYVSYDGSGLSRRLSGAFQAGTLVLCDRRQRPDARHARAIRISLSGRPRISRRPRDMWGCQ